jgi:polyisoprenoid-binding protein YceI
MSIINIGGSPMKKIIAVCFALLSVAAVATAQSDWKLDKAHSNISFSIKHMVISTVTGVFKDFDIVFKSAKEDFSDASVEAVIKVASISTDNDRRDTHLKSDDFFNAEKYPEIKFKSTAFEKTGDGKYKITGDLTIRDVTKRVVFDAVYNGSAKTPWGTNMYSWTATLNINRFDYNLKWSQTIETGGLIVGKDVAVTLNLELNK